MFCVRVDLHSHTAFSMDAEHPLTEMLAAAAAAGIGVFAVTDHCEMNEWENGGFSRDIPASFSAVSAAKGEAPLKLLAGVELGQPLQNLPAAEQLLREYAFDFVLGSLHNNAGRQDFYFYDFLRCTDAEIHRLFSEYYEQLYAMACWNGFDSLAHLTYPYRYLHALREKREFMLDPAGFDEAADAVLRKLIENGKALEYNTSTTTRSEADRALNTRYFRRYRELGGELVTIGSDAHTPDRVGFGIADGLRELVSLGYTHICCYEKRKPVLLPIGD
jgi:histidinol-phosphatase (PHP family)